MDPLTLGWDPLPGLIALALTLRLLAQRRFWRGDLIEVLKDVGPEDSLSRQT